MPAGLCVCLSLRLTPRAVLTPISFRIELPAAFRVKPPNSSGCAFSICASNRTTCAGSGTHARGAEFRGHLRRAPRHAKHGKRARTMQIGADFVDGGRSHGARCLLAENLLIDLGDFREVAERLRRVDSGLLGETCA